MNTDLKKIKKKYGEEMSRLCRKLFPTLLEEEGLLSTLIMDNFAESHSLYNDLVENGLEDDFKNYIYNISNRKKQKVFYDVIETPEELLDKAGYTLYKCNTEDDIQSFKRYYAVGEDLCTFDDNRLERCHVFFAVKKNVDSIKRENFTRPKRQDEYGTSVISIQFTRDESNTLSIKNRYNHTVPNSDATFSNDLENIIAGLEDSFDKTYGLKQKYKNNFIDIPDYIKAKDGKYYKYNFEVNNIYYCPNNVIIDNFEVKKYDKEKYIVLDNFILDLVNKKMSLYDNSLKDSFLDGFKDIAKIFIENDKNTRGKKVTIINKNGSQSYITLNDKNTIKSYCNNELKSIGPNFLANNIDLQEIELSNVREIGAFFLDSNQFSQKISLPNVQKIKNYFLANNINLQEISLPNVIEIGDSFLFYNRSLQKISLPQAQKIGNYFLLYNNALQKISLPKVQEIGERTLFYNKALQEISLPDVQEIGDYFLMNNHNLQEISLPKVQKIKNSFLANNRNLQSISLPSVIEIGDSFLMSNRKIQEIAFPNVQKIGEWFLSFDINLQKISIPSIKRVGNGFLANNFDLHDILSSIKRSDNVEEEVVEGRKL